MKRFSLIFVMLIVLLALNVVSCDTITDLIGGSDSDGSTYTVSFNPNGGRGTAPSRITVSAGTSVILPGEGTLENGVKVFVGWNTSAAGDKVIFYPGSSLAVTGNVTLYAKWNDPEDTVPLNFTVTFNINGGSGTLPRPITVSYVSSVELPDKGNLTRGGCDFGGWNTEAAGDGYTFLPGTFIDISGDITLYAKWDAFTPITSVEINILAPVVNGVPDKMVLNTGDFSSAVSWTPSHDLFRGDQTYTATIRLTANKGYTFSNSISATINKEAARVTSNTGAVIELYYIFSRTIAELVIPATMRTVLGHGYDITGRYANPGDIKNAVLDLDELTKRGRVVRDNNASFGEFFTVTGEDAAKYQMNLSADISKSSRASLEKVASFSRELGATFGIDRARNAYYSFATTKINIAKDGYVIRDDSGLDEFLTQGFKDDLARLNARQLINKYGTHVMLGGVLGARLDHHLSARYIEQSNAVRVGAYSKANAEVVVDGVSVGIGDSKQVSAEFSKYFYTDTTTIVTRAFGGKEEFAQSIHSKGDYDKWINSIEGNERWIDYFPHSLVPLCDLVTNRILSDALATEIYNYCTENGINPEIIDKTDTITVRFNESTGRRIQGGARIKKENGKDRGDGDINTQNGFDTKYQLELVRVELNPDRRSINVTFRYEVWSEKRDGWWFLKGATTHIEMPAKTFYNVPLDRQVIGLLQTRETSNPPYLQGSISGFNHNVISIPGGQLMKNVRIRIDGPGKDVDTIFAECDLILPVLVP